MQPHRFIVVQDEEGLEKIKKAANIFEAPLVIIICGDHHNVWRRPYDGKSMIDIDTSISTDHIMLAATDLHLGTLWICNFKPEIIKREFNLPDHIEPINILAIGYTDGSVASPDRHEDKRLALKDIAYAENIKE